MMLLGRAVVVVCCCGPFLWAEPPQKESRADWEKLLRSQVWFQLSYDAKLTLEQQRTRIYGEDWTFYSPGKSDPPNRTYLTDHDNESQQLVGTIHVNPDANPVWLDFKFLDAGRERVMVGIVKRDGARLHWVRNLWVDAQRWADAKGDVPGRATTFTDKDGKPIGYLLEAYHKP
jgi:hypothetical protein